MIQPSVRWYQSVSPFKHRFWMGCFLAVTSCAWVSEVQAQFLAQDFSTGNASGATATGTLASALGPNATASGDAATAVGRNVQAIGHQSTGVGHASNPTGLDAVGVGYFSSATGEGSTAIGTQSQAGATYATAFGNISLASGASATALGRQANATFASSLALGAGATTTRTFQMMFGKPDNTYTAPGIISPVSLTEQTGTLQFVTTDTDGDLAASSDIFFTSTGSLGLGTNTPTNIAAAANLPGRHFTLKSTGVGVAGLARLNAEGAGGAQLHLIHAGTTANQRVMRIQSSNGVTSFSSVRDDLLTNLVSGCIAIKHLNGNIGLRNINPQHPLHLASGAHCDAGGVWTNACSRELKQDIEPLTSEMAQATVRALQPVGYRYKSDLDDTHLGFIAEDVPDAVATKDRKGLASMDIVAALTKVVQDQDQAQARDRERLAAQEEVIARQQQLLESLNKRLADLEKQANSK